MSRTALMLALMLAQPVPRSQIHFPQDHGSHPDASIEWWYYTGHLQDEKGHWYGFELTFFRLKDLALAHFAWTDVAARTFRYDEKSHLALPGIAEAVQDRLDVTNEDWFARESQGVHRLHARGTSGELDLTLSPQTPPILNGEAGISRKGAGENEYSHYVSIPRLAAAGTFRRGERRVSLQGTAWFDHEWGPGGLPREAVGWDWFALQLCDGTDLMLYRLRTRSGGATSFSAGTFVDEKGKSRPVAWREVALSELGRWRSPRSSATYPARWKIAIPQLGLDLTLEPVVSDQELITKQSTGVVYWEGACQVNGSRAGRPISGRAYVELTGYAGRDVPGFAESER